MVLAQTGGNTWHRVQCYSSAPTSLQQGMCVCMQLTLLLQQTLHPLVAQHIVHSSMHSMDLALPHSPWGGGGREGWRQVWRGGRRRGVQ